MTTSSWTKETDWLGTAAGVVAVGAVGIGAGLGWAGLGWWWWWWAMRLIDQRG